MEMDVFYKVINELPLSTEKITFGGIGEPLTHPEIKEMIEVTKASGRIVEIITNGILLSYEMAKSLTDSKIDKVWISLDSLEEDEYSSIRRGGGLYRVMRNIRGYNTLRNPYILHGASNNDTVPTSKLGICFILMKKNLDSFLKLVKNSYFYGIDDIKATHLIPYDEKSSEQVC